jgi:uncharacterized protein
MHYHLILTEKCNSQCRYCYEKSLKEFDNELDKKWKFDFSSPPDFEIDLEKLEKFLLKDKNPTIIFYGGEPLVNLSKLIEIMDVLEKIPNIRFRIQTNGKLLNKAPIKYLEKIEKILISIDGDKERTDYNRGKGTYDLVIKNIRDIRKRGYVGEIIARMTISPKFPDIFEQIKHLLSLNLFDSIHWQLDAGFYKYDFNKKKFEIFVKKYNEEITKLINFWIENMKERKEVLSLYPFLGIFETLYFNKPTRLRCGAGHSGYAITTNGNLTACPIMNSITNFYAGNLSSNPNKLKKFEIGEPCTSCKYKKICGGRCLYSNKAKLWPEDGEKLICQTIIHLIETLKKKIPEIKKLIKNETINKEQFSYEKYFGPEIIP